VRYPRCIFQFYKKETTSFAQVKYVRKLVYSMVLVLLQQHVGVQVILLTLMNVGYLVAMIVIKPFKSKRRQKLCVISESIFIVILLLLLMSLRLTTVDSRRNMGHVVGIIILAQTGVQLYAQF